MSVQPLAPLPSGSAEPDAAGSDRRTRHRHDQSVFHQLLAQHRGLSRRVTEIAGGIETETRAEDPALVALLHDHASQMHRRLEEGFGLRYWDPAFVEIFAQRNKVRMEITLVPDGVRVRETSDDPNVVLLIRAHGATVSAFVDEGAQAASRESPLPAAYRRIAG